MYPNKTAQSDGDQGTDHQNDDSRVKVMEKQQTAKQSFLAFLSVLAKNKTRRRGNHRTLDNLSRPEVREELSFKGVAVLSDN